MDRLHALSALIALTLMLGACDKDKSQAEAPRAKSRVNAVEAKPEEVPPPEEFCDVYREPDQAADFKYPPTHTEPPSASKKGWRWINVWATWCAPCIEEMPRLATWEGELASKGLADVVFVSADMSPETVEKFHKKRPAMPTGIQMKDPAALKPWVSSFGLETDSLPIHIFVDPSDKVRCLRTAGVTESDRAAVERLLED